MKMKMKTFEVSVVITIEAEDATTAAEEVDTAFSICSRSATTTAALSHTTCWMTLKKWRTETWNCKST